MVVARDLRHYRFRSRSGEHVKRLFRGVGVPAEIRRFTIMIRQAKDLRDDSGGTLPTPRPASRSVEKLNKVWEGVRAVGRLARWSKFEVACE
jgi:hypothetical protein